MRKLISLFGALIIVVGISACTPEEIQQAIAFDHAQHPDENGDPIHDAIVRNFGASANQAFGVAQCESGLDAAAVSSGGGNWGLFQINTVHVDTFAAVTGVPYYDGALDPWANAQFARWLYDQSGGWGPWACRWAA